MFSLVDVFQKLYAKPFHVSFETLMQLDEQVFDEMDTERDNTGVCATASEQHKLEELVHTFSESNPSPCCSHGT